MGYLQEEAQVTEWRLAILVVFYLRKWKDTGGISRVSESSVFDLWLDIRSEEEGRWLYFWTFCIEIKMLGRDNILEEEYVLLFKHMHF